MVLPQQSQASSTKAKQQSTGEIPSQDQAHLCPFVNLISTDLQILGEMCYSGFGVRCLYVYETADAVLHNTSRLNGFISRLWYLGVLTIALNHNPSFILGSRTYGQTIRVGN